jgi:hypothetical protein
VGCGTQPIAGWCNIDIQQLEGVDLVMDVTRDFQFTGVRFIFCEHFIEHLPLDDAIRFLYRCHAALRARGVLRITTPNLDWVVQSHYDPHQTEAPQRLESALALNRAFHGWGHQFIFNAEVLTYLLRAAGFDPVYPCEYGESSKRELCSLERHQRYDPVGVLSDVLIYEAVRPWRRKGQRPLEETLNQAHHHYLQYLDWTARPDEDRP